MPTITDASEDGMHAHDRRVCIYPSYINSKCTVAEGRRIPKDLACEAPNVLEIRDVLEKSMKLPCEVEDKFYPRDFWQRGRVRVTMRKEDGTPLAKEFPTKRSLVGSRGWCPNTRGRRVGGVQAHADRDGHPHAVHPAARAGGGERGRDARAGKATGKKPKKGRR